MLQALKTVLEKEGALSFSVRARPNASRSKVTAIMDDGSVKIDIAAPAEEGKANAELRSFLAEEFDVHSTQVEILAGGGGRRKIVKISR
jgi:uncharacterized protein (TIGR00251 family)